MDKFKRKVRISSFLSLFLIVAMLTPTFAQDLNTTYFDKLPKIDAVNLITNDSSKHVVTKTSNGVFVEQSLEEILKVRPDLKDKIYSILKEKNLLNKDGSINNEKLREESQTVSPNLWFGTEYVYSGRYPANGSTLADWTKQTVWQGKNTTSKEQIFNVSNSYTQGCTVSAEVSINSEAGLSDSLSLNAGVKLSYQLSQSATQQYGATIAVPAYTTYTITGKSFVICYSYYQDVYSFGSRISHDLVGVFVPTGVQWTLS